MAIPSPFSRTSSRTATTVLAPISSIVTTKGEAPGYFSQAIVPADSSISSLEEFAGKHDVSVQKVGEGKECEVGFAEDSEVAKSDKVKVVAETMVPGAPDRADDSRDGSPGRRAGSVDAVGVPMTRFDVVVVGSGIVGLGHALAAVDRGLSVVVVDRAGAIGGASVRNFGHLCFTPQSGLAREFALRSRPLWLRLAADAGVWLRESGTVVVARADDELAVLSELAAQRGTESLFGSGQPDVVVLSAAEVNARLPLAPDTARGGAMLAWDLQVNPRQAAAGLAAYLASRGVEFRYRTAVTAVRPGRVTTTRGSIDAGTVIVAVNHDIDQLYPEIAERDGIVRCGLDMLRVDAGLRAPLPAPVLTGWSLLRYGAFSGLPAAAVLGERLRREYPALGELDLNQMYTQLPDGSLIVGDTHYRGASVSPFQNEHAFEQLLHLTGELFGVTRPHVLERWQGVYASGRADFLIDQPELGVYLVAATTGIGMTTGLGLAEHVIATVCDSPISLTLKGTP
ncbi:TIGR03364 family FAD-dependent oxidoreductase [Cryobacterium serini]|nr:TIGR03364 family FAD-dependent oxidoreductase [Cryobacterium serini]